MALAELAVVRVLDHRLASIAQLATVVVALVDHMELVAAQAGRIELVEVQVDHMALVAVQAGRIGLAVAVVLGHTALVVVLGHRRLVRIGLVLGRTSVGELGSLVLGRPVGMGLALILGILVERRLGRHLGRAMASRGIRWSIGSICRSSLASRRR